MIAATIVAGGARTAVGETLHETTLSLATGVRRVREAAVIGRSGERLMHAPVVSPSLEGGPAVDALMHAAAADLSSSLSRTPQAGAGGARLGVVLLSDAHAPPFFPVEEPEARFLADLALVEHARLHALSAWPQRLVEVLGPRFKLAQTVVTPADGSLGAHYLKVSLEWLERDFVDLVVLGGIGCGAESGALRWLALQGLTRAPNRDEGVVPGQAAALLAISREPTGGPRILAANYGDQRRAGPSALTDAMEAVLDGSTSPSEVVLDSSGMPGRKAEWAGASTRTLGRRGWSPRVSEPILGLGDVGAATLPLLLGLLTTRSILSLQAEPTTSGLTVLLNGFSTGRGAVRWEV